MLLPGKRLCLTRSALAIAVENGQRAVLTIPAGAVVTILPGYEDGHVMIDALWVDRTVTLFSIDLKLRAYEVERSRSAVPPPAQ